MKLIKKTELITTLVLGGTLMLSGQADLSVSAVSFEQDNYPAVYSIDGHAGTGWAINPNEENPNYIHYDVTGLAPGPCEIRMEFNFGTYHVMEQFTISWSDDNGSSWYPITVYSSLAAQSGLLMTVDESGQVTTSKAATDKYTLTTSLGNITDLRIDVPANGSHRGEGSYLNENYVLSEFSVTSVSELIHLWTFDEGTDIVAADSVGGADGKLIGATWAEDRFGKAGKAIQLGHNKWVDPPDTVKTEIGTFAAWIYADAHGGYNQAPGPIFSAEQGSGASNFAYRLQLHETGVIAFEAVAPWGNGAARVAVSDSTIPLNTWTHVAGTYDGYTTKVYINGKLDGSSPTYGAYAGMNTSTSIRVGIGHLAGWSVQWFQGRVDDARVYDVALDQAGIQQMAGVWNGYAVDEDGWVDTGDWIGWIYVAHAPWIWVEDLMGYVYLDESSWMWLPRE